MSKLKTETNTPAIDARIVRAAAAALDTPAATLQTDFEHGQWWVTILGTGAQYSVCDAEGGDSIDGFGFEQVSQGDSE